MAESQNRAEKLLKDYAEKRKADAGSPQIHPVTRKLLQSEATRLYGKEDEILPESDEKPSWFLQLWPRLAFGLLTLGFLVFAVIFSQPQRSAKDLAQISADQTKRLEADTKDSSPALLENHLGEGTLRDSTIQPQSFEKRAASSGNKNEPAAVDGSGFISLQEDKELEALKAKKPSDYGILDEKKLLLAKETEAAAKQEEVKLKDNVSESPSTSELPRQQEILAPQKVTAPSAAIATQSGANSRVPERASLARVKQEGQNQAFRFTRETQTDRLRRNFQSPPRQEVLNQFNLNVAGDVVVITETDGSVYKGTLTPAKDRLAVLSTASPQPSAPRGDQAQTIPLSFQAEGLNAQLNQKVKITAVFFPEVLVSQKQDGPSLGIETNMSSQMQLRGTISIGKTTIPLNATSEK